MTQDAAKTHVKVTDFGVSLELTGDPSVYYKDGALPWLHICPRKPSSATGFSVQE